MADGVSPARRVALSLLREQRLRDSRARELLRGSRLMEGLAARDRALATRLVLGVVSARGMLDALVDACLRPGGHLEPRVRDALRISAYELLFLGTPEAVAVSQGVELARRANRRCAGLANAVLRRVAERDVPRRESALARLRGGGTQAEDLSLVGGLPVWMSRALVDSRGAGFARELVLSLADPAPVYVAANAFRHDPPSLERILSDAGLAPRPTVVPGGFELESPASLAGSGLVDNVDLMPADLSAQKVALLASRVALESRSGDEPPCVLELGQGRGTKTLLMQSFAQSAGCELDVISVELEPFKCKLATDRVLRAGCARHCRTINLDGSLLDAPGLPDALDRGFDLVLVDAPCSGVGTLRRHPEIAWSLGERSVSTGGEGELPALQLRLLEASASHVRAGGALLYGTCSALRAEDEDVVASFLSTELGEEFEPEPLQAWLEDVHPGGGSSGMLCFPQRPGGPDAHFCALLRRRGL